MPHLDADRAQVAADRLPHRGVGRPRVEVARVEAVRIPGLGQQLLRLRRIVGMGIERERELELPRDQAAVGPRGAERLRLAERLAIEREAGGQPHPPVVPRRLRVPLIEVVEVVRADAAREGELERGILLDVLRLRGVEEVGEVHLAALEHGQARVGVGHALVDQPLDRGHLAPVALVGLHHELDAGGVADELVGPEADRVLLEAVGPHLLHVLLGGDPARAGRVGPVEGHEVGPRLVEVEAHPVGSRRSRRRAPSPAGPSRPWRGGSSSRTSSAVNGSPLWNLSPSRSLNS